MWISQENENSKGQTGNQPSPQSRTQVPDNCIVNFSFPKQARILSRGHFQRLQREGSKLVGATLVMNYRQGRSSRPKLGVTVSRQYGKAHDRNRFKRLVRETFRQLCSFLPKDLEINVGPKNTNKCMGPLKIEAVLKDFHHLAAKFNRPNASPQS
jgi:ribonuclease P protein component